MNPFLALGAHLPRLWHLWELVLLNQPLLALAPSPPECSSAVAALVGLVAPLPYGGDFRPYFTVHDAAFGAMAAGGLPPAPGVPHLLGVTNILFLKTLPGFPNVLTVGPSGPSGGGPGGAPGRPGGGAAAVASPGNGGGAGGLLPSWLRPRTPGPAAADGGGAPALRTSPGAEPPLCAPDAELLARLPAGGAGGGGVSAAAAAKAAAALRKHFFDLTSAFLEPLQRRGLLPGRPHRAAARPGERGR